MARIRLNAKERRTLIRMFREGGTHHLPDERTTVLRFYTETAGIEITPHGAWHVYRLNARGIRRAENIVRDHRHRWRRSLGIE
jgi:hypothetical protein